jgi:hypothetical protein
MRAANPRSWCNQLVVDLRQAASLIICFRDWDVCRIGGHQIWCEG